MPKTRTKRKVPVTVTAVSSNASTSSSSNKPIVTRTVIRKFHVLKKRQVQLQKVVDQGDSAASVVEDARKELVAIAQEIADIGGLESYQKMSVIGQGTDRGGGSEKVLLEFLAELGHPQNLHGERWKVLEVGALKPDNYAACSSWMDVTAIDLHSRHPLILEQDFLLMDEEDNRGKWVVISLSLVVNFVPDVKDRGRMLRLAHTMLRPGGYLFVALPLPCITNSRYLTPEHFEGLMHSISFSQVKSRWKDGGKMAYWLFQKSTRDDSHSVTPYQKKTILRTGNRNNFCILL